jgi:uncharacterized protein (UPF0303 family)
MTDTALPLTIEALEAELAPLVLPQFDETTAFRLGSILVGLATSAGAPVVISIRNAHRTFFHAALPGASAANDLWARRKGNLALHHDRASMVVTLRMRAHGRTLAGEGLSEADYAISGGAVPIRVAGAGTMAVCTVSGLPETEDHALVVAGLQALLA